ncbi:MAG: hypothetical protein HY958_02030 [Bacteroidia bacterium]|nr:hypothetical protein [Bacteroidia bacterium]
MSTLNIKYYKHPDIDYKKWDACITGAFNGIVYASSWYLDIVCGDWEALIEGDYEMVMPLTCNKKYGIFYLYQPYFTQQLGVFSLKRLDAITVDMFIKAIPNKYRFVEINLNTFNKIDNPVLPGRKNVTYELDLIRTYDKVFKEYSTNTKRNIKKTLENKIYVTKGTQPEVLISLFRNDTGKDLKKLTDIDYDRLRKLMSLTISHKIGQLYFAYNENNEVCAGAFFVTTHQKSIFLFSASNKEGKEKSAMFAVIDGFIKINSERNITLDFEGSNIEGLARFYASFGAKACEYLTIKINRLPWIIRLFKK